MRGCSGRSAVVEEEIEVLAESGRRPWLIVESAQLHPREVDALQSVRRRSVAALIALGSVQAGIRSSLSITHTVSRPFGSEALRAIIDDTHSGGGTMRMRKLDAASAI